MRTLYCVMIGMLLSVTAACGVEPPLPASSSQSVMLAETYRLGGGDRFKLNVYEEPNLSGGEYAISSEGEASLPLVGPVKLGGLTQREAEAAIAAKYANGFLSSPKVNIDVMQRRPFYILGEVNQPGEYPYVEGMTLLNAVAKAGGFTYRAQRRFVYVRHSDSGAEKQVVIAADSPVLPGDTVRVLERFF